MLMHPSRRQSGLTIIEIAITLVILAIVLALGMPSYSAWIQNSQIRTAAETTASALQLARAEALNRNVEVRFQLMTSLTSACVSSTSGNNWIVSVEDPAGKCEKTSPDESPFIIRKQTRADGVGSAEFLASQKEIVFNGLGRITPVPADTITINITNPLGGSCVAQGGAMRCLQIQVMGSGQVRMCDPAVTASTDPRKC
jgi:type IV fimbrial biogenesis protein FimT